MCERAAIMLRGLIAPMEKHHKVRISDAAIVARRAILASLYSGPPIARQGGQPARHRLRACRDQPDAKPAAVEDAQVAHRRARTGKSGAGARARPRRGRRGADRGDRRGAGARAKLARPRGANGPPSESWSREIQACAPKSPKRRRAPAKEKLAPRRRRRRRRTRRGRSGTADPAERASNCATRSANSKRSRPEKRMIYAHVDEQAVASVVSDWTGIPVGRMVADEVETVLKLPEILNRRVVGQSPRPFDDRQAHRDQPRQARQSQQADRRVHAVRPIGRRQDRDRAGARRNALRRRAEHDHHQHVRVPGGAHGLDAEGRAARLCRLWRGRPADRGGAPRAL